MKETCICLAGDVKGSRQLDPASLIISLTECKSIINERFAEEILIPFDIRNGDEIVGVIKSFSTGYLAIRKLMDTLNEKKIYLYTGLGLGKLDSLNATVHTMNGSAVLNAFKARDHYLKKQHPEAAQWKIKGEKGTSFFFYSEDYPYQALNALTYSILGKVNKRSDKQKKVINIIEENSALNYEKIGKQLGYNSPKSTISHLLSRADYEVVNAMENSLQCLLDELQRWFKKGNLN